MSTPGEVAELCADLRRELIEASENEFRATLARNAEEADLVNIINKHSGQIERLTTSLGKAIHAVEALARHVQQRD